MPPSKNAPPKTVPWVACATHVEFKHIRIEDRTTTSPARTKTRLWYVFNKYDGGFLGEIKWFGRWHCYSFFPMDNCVFEKVCLRDLASFLEEQTTAHRKKPSRLTD